MTQKRAPNKKKQKTKNTRPRNLAPLTDYAAKIRSRIFTLKEKKRGHPEVTDNAACRLPRLDVASHRRNVPPPRARASDRDSYPRTSHARERKAQSFFQFPIFGQYFCYFFLISIFYFLVDAPAIHLLA